MDFIKKRDRARRRVLEAVAAGSNPFVGADRVETSEALMHLTWHGYVIEHTDHPSGRSRQLGPAQGSLFCSWHGRRL